MRVAPPRAVRASVEDLFANIALGVAKAIEFGAVLFIAIGAIEAFLVAIPAAFFQSDKTPGARRRAYRLFGTWLSLALEFELAADIIRSATAPTWTDIGQLGAIAVIRTFLNYFLERDLRSDRDAKTESVAS